MNTTLNATHTDKELLILKDQLEAEALTIKKFMDYKQDLQDPELSSMVDQMIKNHQDHYNRLLAHIK